VRKVAGDVIADVQHVGSTAVPGLAAKPILDLAAAVSTLDVIPELIARFTTVGYMYRGDRSKEGGHLFVRESEPDVRSIHLHVVTSNDVQWRNYLLFRDLLRQNSDLRKRYAQLKGHLRARFPDDRKLYTASKHDFIRGILNNEAQQTHAEATSRTAPSAASEASDA
jgi:GrpB-like predicted nucleotidyltransferase (UPF0157 family)